MPDAQGYGLLSFLRKFVQKQYTKTIGYTIVANLTDERTKVVRTREIFYQFDLESISQMITFTDFLNKFLCKAFFVNIDDLLLEILELGELKSFFEQL